MVCAIAVTQAHAADLLKIENAGSPNGKYVLEAVATSDDACRVDLKSEADGFEHQQGAKHHLLPAFR